MSNFSLLNNTDITQRAQEALISLYARKKNKEVTLSNYVTLPKNNGLSIDPINLQYALGFKEFAPGTILEIIGGDGIGKTTFVFTLMGMFMRNANAPCLFVNSEGTAKRLDDNRMAACLHTNKEIAFKLLSTISMDRGSALKETLESVDEWVKMMRTKVQVPYDIPLIVAIDTLSKLVPPSEARSLGFKEANESSKGLGESSNLEFSKLMHEWCRTRATFLEQENVFLIAVSHQNDTISMSRGYSAAAFMSEEQKAANNKTKIGGRALNQSAAVQISLTRIMGIKDSNNVIESHLISLKVLKNSLGPDQRTCTYRLRKENLQNTDTTFESSLDFYSSIAEMMAKLEILGTKEVRKRYSCEALSLDGLTAYEFGKAIQENSEFKNKLGNILHIRGYEPPVIDVSVADEEEAKEPEDESDITVLEDKSDDNLEHELPDDIFGDVQEPSTQKKKRGRKPKSEQVIEQVEINTDSNV